MADVRATRASVITDPATGTQQAGVDASGNLQVILASNTGVDVGDVDVLSVIPGSGATNLGKAIQTAQGTTDIGVGALVVRNDVLADLAGADGDWTALQVNATGALYVAVDGTVTVDLGANNDVTIDGSSVVGTDGTAGPADTLSVGGTEAGGNIQELRVDSDGHLQIDVLSGGGGTEYTEDVAAPADPVGLAIMMRRDDVLASSPVDAELDWMGLFGTAEGALWVQDFNSDAILTDTNTIAGDTTSIDSKITACDTGAVVISSGTVTTVTTVSTVTNLAQLGGAAVSMNTGVRDAGTQRVTIATDDSVPTVPAGPTNPGIDITNITTPVGIAAGASSNLDSADLVTKKLHQAQVSGAAPFKVIFATLSNGVATNVGVAFGDFSNPVIWEPPHPDFVVSGSGAGADGFRAIVTNLDPNDTTDFYAAFYYAD